MSSDYRPRGGGSSSSSGGGSGRRRRGGRGRNSHGHSSSGENRLHTNGSSSTPKKEQGLFGKLFGWLSGKKKTEARPTFRSSTSTPSSGSPVRPDFKDSREPRAERPPRQDRPKAEPVPQEIVSPKLYVGNLAYEAAESDLFDLFSKVGSVKNVEIAMDRHSNRSKGFGFVEMESLETAKEAAAKLNRTDFMGRQIVVSGAKVDKRPQNPREADPTSHDASGSNSPDATI